MNGTCIKYSRALLFLSRFFPFLITDLSPQGKAHSLLTRQMSVNEGIVNRALRISSESLLRVN